MTALKFKKGSLDDLVGGYDKFVVVSRLKEGLSDTRYGRSDANYNRMKQIAAKVAGTSDLSPEQIEKNAQRYGQEGLEDASHTLERDYNGIVRELSDRAISILSMNDEIKQRLGPEYEGLVVRTEAYEQSKQKAEKVRKATSARAALGELLAGIEDKEQREALLGSIAQKVGEKRANDYKAKGYSIGLQNLVKEGTHLALARGQVSVDLIQEAANYLVEQTRKELDKYMASTGGKNVRDYVTQALGKMAEGEPKEFQTALGLVYGAHKAAQKMPKQEAVRKAA